MPRLAIIGLGKMGRAIEQLAPERGWQIVARIAAADNPHGDGITAESLAGAEVAIDFTTPDAAVANVHAAISAGCPIVVGTTGWYAALPTLTQWVDERDGALLTAPNFSLGVAVFEQVLQTAARLFAHVPGFEAQLIETHHSAKKDAPSGTALKLARMMREPLGRDVGITSVRVGSVPGTHEVVFDGVFEQVRLSHEARDRRVFAEGALVAARWLIGRRGTFTMRDVLESSSHTDSVRP